MQKEKWKRCVIDKNYLISSWGRIFSLKSKKFLRPQIHQSRSNKYLRIELGGSNWMIHILMGHSFKRKEYLALKAQHPDLGEKQFQVNHKDRNTLNPNVNNIEWTTESENKLHMHETSVITFGGKTYKGKMDA